MRWPETWRRVRALGVPVLLLVLVPVELVSLRVGMTPGWLLLGACLLPWRRVVGLPAATSGSPERSWHLLGVGVGVASLGTWALSLLEPSAAVLVLLPVVVSLPLTLRGGWGAVVGHERLPTTVLDLALVMLALVMLSWTWLLDDVRSLDPAATAAALLAFGAIAFVAGLATTRAVEVPGRRVELGAFALAMTAFAVALLTPGTGAIAAYGNPQLYSYLGYSLTAFAIVRGQLRSVEYLARPIVTGVGGTTAVALLLIVAFLGDSAITARAGIPNSPTEGILQALLLLGVAARVFVTSRGWRVAHSELDRIAHTDSLTGLRNRLWLTSRLAELMTDTSSGGTSVAMIDLDRFKVVNDSRGHEMGDTVLQEAARRIVQACRPHDVVRFGGDEFLVVLPASTSDPVEVAETIRAALAVPMVSGARRVQMAASVGVATANDDDGPSDLVRNADVALYQAKEQGRNCVVCFDDDLRDASLRRLMIENGLRTSVDDGSLSVAYQPVVNAISGELVSAEALLRWTSPELGPVGPGEFIPIAEEIGAIVAMGSWVIDRVCADLSEMDRRAGVRQVPRVSINVSGVQLLVGDLEDVVARHLQVHGLTTDRLVIEVTESALLDSSGVAAQGLFALHDAGVQLAVDDFGTGYSALSYLESFPIGVLKIDRSFVRPLSSSSDDVRSMVPTLVRIAQALDLHLVAEGVEDEVQRDALVAMGCALHQGYLHARPMPLDALIARVVPRVVA